MQPSELVISFIEAINAHDPERIVGLCTADHRFVDAHGGVVTAETLLSAWQGYFRFMPHYAIEADQILADGDLVAVFGHARGSLNAADASDRSWRRPCAWRAQVHGDRVKVWQVYVDTKVVFDLI